jgi:hypothetical protein
MQAGKLRLGGDRGVAYLPFISILIDSRACLPLQSATLVWPRKKRQPADSGMNLWNYPWLITENTRDRSRA